LPIIAVYFATGYNRVAASELGNKRLQTINTWIEKYSHGKYN